MKKTILALLLALPLCANAQTAFTVTSDGKQYSFPIESEITLTDNELWTPDTIVKEVHDTVGTLHTASWLQVELIVKDYITSGKLGSEDNGKLATLVGDSLWQIDFTVTDPSAMCFALRRKGYRISHGKQYLNYKQYGASEDDEQKVGTAAEDCYFAMTTFSAGTWRVYINETTLQYAFVKLNSNGTPDFSTMVGNSSSAALGAKGIRKISQTATCDTVNFEGSYWKSLIDSPQYGGPLLYSASGMGFTTDSGVYEWTDSVTGLHSKLNKAYGSWAYWSGGAAVSNYHCAIADGGYMTQLSIPDTLDAHSGNNFIVTYGYNDGNQFSTDSRPIFNFLNGEKRIKELYVANTCYFIHSTTYGDQFNTSASDTTYIDVTFEGFDADGNSLGTVPMPIQTGKEPMKGWNKVDLSELGYMASFKINYDFSDDQTNSAGFTAPAYVAIDDITILK